MQPSQEQRGEGEPRSRQEAQRDLILREFGDALGRGPENWQQTGVEYTYRAGHILVREEHVERARGLLPTRRAAEQERAEDIDADLPIVAGLRRLRLADGLDPLNAVRIVRDGRDRDG